MAVLDSTSLATRRALDRVFATLATDPDITLPGVVRGHTADGSVDVWIRRGPILLRGSTVWTRLYMATPFHSPVTITPGKVPINVVDVTNEDGPWHELFLIAVGQLQDDLVVALRRLTMAAYESKLVDKAHMAARGYMEAFGRGKLPPDDGLKLTLAKGRSRAGSKRA